MAKIEQIYNLDSFNEAKKYFAQDSAKGGLLMARSLEYISGQVFEQRIAGLTFLSSTGLTVNNEGGYAKAITKLKVNYQGDFADSGSTDLTNGKISLGVEDDTIPVFAKSASSDWSYSDLQEAQLENRNLVSDFIKGHNQKYQEALDTIGYLGNGTKTKGLLNYAGFTSSAAAKTFALSTGKEMYDVIAGLITDQRNAVLNDAVFSCDKVAMSPATFNIISKTFIDGLSGLVTVAEAIERQMNVTFVQTAKATISSVNRIVAYASSNQAIQFRIPVALNISNQWNLGFRYGVESSFRVAGVDVIESASARIVTGV